jgi:ubiquinone/menaquinone biosynthesis C-methylase UbiE
MGFWESTRVPEPEVMDEAEQVESYSSAAAARHLDAIDNTFLEHLLRLIPPDRGPIEGASWALDVGTGPAEIPIKILRRIPGMKIAGIDRSHMMLARARENGTRAGVSDRLALLAGDGQSLPFPDGAFSMVLCNSVLHHAREPAEVLREIFRVAAPGAPILVRDLRRPPRPLLRWHLWRHGRHYRGRMRRLFDDSVRAAYTVKELERLIETARLRDATAFRFRGAHIGIERKSVPPFGPRSGP